MFLYLLGTALLLTPLVAENYSNYRYIASKKYGKCFKATSYNGADYSVNTLKRKYDCEAQENDQLGGLILKCQMPEGSTAFVYTQTAASCQSALRAIRNM